MRTPYNALIRDVAAIYALDPDLVEAMVIKESSGNPWAWNPEPHYRYLWNVRTNAPFRKLSSLEIANETPPKDFPTLAGDRDQEFWGQQASWGLMQVMGAVAREYGFRYPFLSALCDPRTGLEYGAKHLAAALRWAQGDIRAALAAYNSGRAGGVSGALQRAGAYADAVLGIYTHVTRS